MSVWPVNESTSANQPRPKIEASAAGRLAR
jgi:hypothetical protein